MDARPHFTLIRHGARDHDVTRELQWTGYEPSVGAYQGEIVSKAEAQDRFWVRLKACQADPGVVNATDWRGIRAILGELLTAFRNLDRDQILNGFDDYYGDRD